jgi:hypothetical protein
MIVKAGQAHPETELRIRSVALESTTTRRMARDSTDARSPVHGKADHQAWPQRDRTGPASADSGRSGPGGRRAGSCTLRQYLWSCHRLREDRLSDLSLSGF